MRIVAPIIPPLVLLKKIIENSHVSGVICHLSPIACHLPCLAYLLSYISYVRQSTQTAVNKTTMTISNNNPIPKVSLFLRNRGGLVNYDDNCSIFQLCLLHNSLHRHCQDGDFQRRPQVRLTHKVTNADNSAKKNSFIACKFSIFRLVQC